MRAIDWLGRLVLLVLSSLATLALIGSLASVSNTPLGRSFPGDVTRPGEPLDFADERAVQAEPLAPGARGASAGSGTTLAMRVGRDGPGDVERWLKALTYAVLALAGFAAAVVVALLRVAHHLGRIADR